MSKRWIDLDYAAALYIATQIQLAGGREADCIPVAVWYLRRNDRRRYVTESFVLQLWGDALCCTGEVEL